MNDETKGKILIAIWSAVSTLAFIELIR